MKYRIAIWALAGFSVAGFWAILAAATSSWANDPIRQMWALVCVTCPIAITGMHHSIGLYMTLVANTATYALVGLIFEGLRKRLHHA